MTEAAATLTLVERAAGERALALPAVRRGSQGDLLARLARGEALERMRRPAFLVALAFMIYAAYVYLPHAGFSYLTVEIHGYRPRYNSAGVGGMLALLANTFIGLAGFYLVRGAIQRDRETGVGAVLAATPLSRVSYLLSKLLSGFAVLASMMAMLWLAGGALQMILGEDRRLDLVALLQPLLVFCLPAMLMVAAVAVAFDSWPLFRGGLGNVAYFILWMSSLARAGLTTRAVSPLEDPYGANAIIGSLLASARAGAPGTPFPDQSVSVGFHVFGKGQHVWPKFIDWSGVSLTAPIAASRLAWVSFAVLLVAASSLVFDRFAEAAALTRRRSRRAIATGGDATAVAEARVTVHSATALAPPARGGSLLPLLTAEWALLLRPTHWTWKLVALGLVIAQVFAPLTVAKSFLVAAAWIWPLLVWSELGTRERRYGTAPLLFSTPRPLGRPLAAGWLAGAALALLLVIPVIVRSLIVGQAPAALALVVGAGFVPALAMAAGSLTGGRKLFEVLYLLLWYVGPLNHVASLDYTGAAAAASPFGPMLGFAVAAALLLAVAWAARKRALEA
jgi:hypothetical protein